MAQYKKLATSLVFLHLLLSTASPVHGAENPKDESTLWDDVKCKFIDYGLPVAVGVGAVAAAPAVLGALGFGTAGVVAGTAAAKGMSVLATASGGGVVAGTLFAGLQSAGAAGIGLAGKAAVGAAAGVVFEGIRKMAGYESCSDALNKQNCDD